MKIVHGKIFHLLGYLMKFFKNKLFKVKLFVLLLMNLMHIIIHNQHSFNVSFTQAQTRNENKYNFEWDL